MTAIERNQLTAAQREVMEIVWKAGEVSVSQVRDRLPKHRVLSRNTIQTVMVRLEERGWLKHREEARTFIYSAKLPRTVSLGAKVAQLVDQFFGGSPDDMVTALIEYRGLTIEEADRIRSMLQAVEAKRSDNKKNSTREKE